MNQRPKLFLIDAMGLIFRAYYAMIKSPRITSKGLNTSAILGFTNMFYEILKKEKPTHIAVAFDTGAPTFRHADFQAYKANREATPDDIVNSVPYIKRILQAFRVSMLAMDGYEADDIVGTLAKHAEIEGFDVYMMTSDKDYGQLVSPNIKMYRPGKFGQPAEILGSKEICEKYKIKQPEQLIDFLGLCGDSSDNIPGVPTIGPVRAQKLLAQYGSIENMYACGIDHDNEKTRTLLLEHKEQALLSKQLATIMIDVPITYRFEDMVCREPDLPALKEVFKELEFQSLSQRIFKDLQVQQPERDLFTAMDETAGAAHPEEMIDLPASQLHRIDTPDEFETHKPEQAEHLFFDWIMQEGRIAGFAFTWDGNDCFYHFVENEHRHYQPLLRDIFCGAHTVVTYDSKPTFKYLKIFKIDSLSPVIDLQIAHYLIQPESRHDLSTILLSCLGLSFKSAPRNILSETAERAISFARLYQPLMQELEKDQLKTLFQQIEMPLVPVLAEMELCGVKVDVPTLQKNAETMDAELHELENRIYGYAGVTFNIASPKQLGEVLFDKMCIIKNAKLTKNKQYQTGEEVLLKMAHKHPIVPLILEWRKLAKLKSTYIDALPHLINPKTGRIHTTFTQTVTSTGRLSSINPNLQNIPMRTERGRDIRKAFVASDENHCLMAADYSQIELRIVAHVCGDERMIDAFRNGEDIHATMAAHIFNVSPADVTPDMRRTAKTVNFGILYGISAFGLADRLQIPQLQARQLIEDYNHSFPKIHDYMENTLAFARQHLYVETLFGRRRYIRDINAPNAILRKAAERNAINAPIQGTAADLIKIAMVQIHNDIKNMHLQSKMILQVHDELVFDVLKEELPLLKTTVRKRMSEAMPLSVPLDVNISEGKNWFEAH